MKRTRVTGILIACIASTTAVVRAESWLEDFDNHTTFPDLYQLKDTGLWWSPDTGDPRAEWGKGLAGSTASSAASHNYHWRQRPFVWKDPTVAAIIVQLDFQTPTYANTYFPFRNDQVGWSINEFSTDSAEWLQVRLNRKDSTTGLCSITGAWPDANGSGVSPTIATYSGALVKELTFYRFQAKFTKLTSTSFKLDVTLTEINSDGTVGAVVATGSIADSAALGADAPGPNLFTATTMWPSFRNYNGNAKAFADNAYLEIVRIEAPDCYSAVTPDENTINYAEADISLPATPSSFDYQVRNLGLNSLTYTVTELNDQQQPANVGWLSTNKSGATVAAQTSDTLTASINTAGLAGGNYTAYLKFTDNCNPAISHVRQINLAVYGCRWTVNSCNQERSYSLGYPTVLPQDFVYRITNTGNYPLNYSVAKTPDSEATCFEWVNVTNPTGTIAVGQYVDVVGHIDVNALVGHATNSDYNCILTFTDNCSPQVVTRQVRIRYLGAGDDQVFEYQGNVDPDTENSAGTGMKFYVYENVANGSVVDDPDAIDGKAWRMVDQYGSYKSRYRAQYWTGSAWDNMGLHAEGGSTMVARLKVSSWGGGDTRCWIDIEDTDTSSGAFHWGGADGVAEETKRGILEQTGLGTSDYVTLWIATKGDQPEAEWQCGRTVDMYLLNDQQAIIWQKHITAASTENSTRSGFFFGDDSTAATMDVSYDWITGTNAGAFAPGEEVAILGRSLILTDAACIIAFPDADGDSDVDMADFAALQRCYSPTMELSEDCRCFDRDHNGNIDEVDFQSFAACAGGPGIPFDPMSPPANCHP